MKAPNMQQTTKKQEKIECAEDLMMFFAECDSQQINQEDEPDWKDHLKTIRRSYNDGFELV